MKFYIASRLENAEQVRQLKTILESWGWVHTYDWTVLPGGRGTHVEIGLGIAGQKNVFVLAGDVAADFGRDGRTCAFYHHPLVTQCETWASLVGGLRGLHCTSTL